METITNLIKDTPIPKMVRVRQNFDKTCIPENDIPGIILRDWIALRSAARSCPARRLPLPAAAGALTIMP